VRSRSHHITREEEYDWLGKYADVRDLLGSVLKKSDRILLIGCGNSTLSADLYGMFCISEFCLFITFSRSCNLGPSDDGYENLVNIDYSSVVIESMRARHSEARPKMQWLCMNMLDMSFDAHAFDVVLDKAAMDALCVRFIVFNLSNHSTRVIRTDMVCVPQVDEEDVWDPKESCRREVHQLCRGIHRVLTPNGLFIQISFAQPHFRRRYLDRPDHYGWKFEVQTFGALSWLKFYLIEKKKIIFVCLILHRFWIRIFFLHHAQGRSSAGCGRASQVGAIRVRIQSVCGADRVHPGDRRRRQWRSVGHRH
jgi:SAM-dependent methyltransferase